MVIDNALAVYESFSKVDGNNYIYPVEMKVPTERIRYAERVLNELFNQESPKLGVRLEEGSKMDFYEIAPQRFLLHVVDSYDGKDRLIRAHTESFAHTNGRCLGTYIPIMVDREEVRVMLVNEPNIEKYLNSWFTK